MNNLLTYKTGPFFPKSFQYLGLVGIIFSIATFTEYPIRGLVIILVGILIFTTVSGIQLNPKDRLYRSYTSILKLKFGQWYSIEKFPFIAIIRSRVSETIYGGRSMLSTTSTVNYFDICLLSSNHRDKIVIKKFEELDKSTSELYKLSEVLNVEIKKFDK